MEECQGTCKDFQYGSECVHQCPVLTYASSNLELWRSLHPSASLRAEKVCMPCNPMCASGCSGPGPDNCQGDPRCVDLVDVNGTCVATCADGSYAAEDRCSACDSRCATCDGPGVENCDLCAHVRNAAGRCASACGENEYLQSAGSCAACHPECGGVCYGPSEAQCFASADATDAPPRCQHVSYKRKCLAECPPSTFADADGVCQVCHAECSLEGCHGPAATDCQTCKHVLVGDTCARECPAGTYRDAGDNTCRACHASCSDGCDGPAAQDCGSTGSGSSSGSCDGVTLQGECLQSCPQGYFASDTQTCLPCAAGCQACTGRLPSDCTTCVELLFVDETGLHACVDACPQGYYADEAQKVCVGCDPLCAACYGPGPAACQACTKAVTPEGECVAACPAGTFDVQGSGGGKGESPLPAPLHCVACHSECDPAAGCTGPADGDCVACRHAALDGSCVTTCPRSHYQDATQQCQPCDAQCAAGCSGPGPSRCTNDACVSYRMASTGACVDACPQGTYVGKADDATSAGTCLPCDASCDQGCTGPGGASCTSDGRDPGSGPLATTTVKRLPSSTTTGSPDGATKGGEETAPEKVQSAGWEIGIATALLLLVMGAVGLYVFRSRMRAKRVAGSWMQYSVLKNSDFQDEDLMYDEGDDDEEEVFKAEEGAFVN